MPEINTFDYLKYLHFRAEKPFQDDQIAYNSNDYMDKVKATYKDLTGFSRLKAKLLLTLLRLPIHFGHASVTAIGTTPIMHIDVERIKKGHKFEETLGKLFGLKVNSLQDRLNQVLLHEGEHFLRELDPSTLKERRRDEIKHGIFVGFGTIALSSLALHTAVPDFETASIMQKTLGLYATGLMGMFASSVLDIIYHDKLSTEERIARQAVNRRDNFVKDVD